MTTRGEFDDLIGCVIAKVWRVGEFDYGAAIAFRVLPGEDKIVALDRLLSEGDAAAMDEVERYATTPIAVYEFGQDCCSETWLADVVGFDALIGGEVLSVTAVALPEGHLTDQARTHQEVDDVMGWEFRTRKGVCTIAVRNSSNGYYGGWVEPVKWRDGLNDTAEQIEGDFSA